MPYEGDQREPKPDVSAGTVLRVGHWYWVRPKGVVRWRAGYVSVDARAIAWLRFYDYTLDTRKLKLEDFDIVELAEPPR